MTPLAQAGWWAAVVVGLIGTALLSGLETGVYRLNRVKLELRAVRGPRAWAAGLLKRETEHPERLLASNLVMNIFFGDLAATGASALLAARGYSDTTIVLINAAILTPVFFVFVESIPKELFRLEADRLTYRFAPFLVAVRVLLTYTGVLWLVRHLSSAVTRLVGGEGEKGLESTARERVATMLKETAATGVLSESQAGLVDRALAFRAIPVVEEMVPWSDVRSVPVEWDRATALRMLARTRFTYYPLVERRGVGGAGRVVGVLRYQDLFLRPEATPVQLAKEPARLPPRTPLREAVLSLRRAGAMVGIVEEGGEGGGGGGGGEWGRPVGLVTMADLVDPLMGGDADTLGGL